MDREIPEKDRKLLRGYETWRRRFKSGQPGKGVEVNLVPQRH